MASPTKTLGGGVSVYDPINSKRVKKAGNWYEEIVLEHTTGIKYYPDPKDRSKQLLTKDRCIVHTERLDPKEYRSNTQLTIIDPSTHPDRLTDLQNRNIGPKKAAMEAKMRADVENNYKSTQALNQQETRKVNYQSVNSESFNIPGFKPKLIENDPTLRIQTKNADYATDNAITYFSDSLYNGKDINFPVTFTNSQNPFRKSSAFSADTRLEPFARNCETNERPAPMPTYVDFRALQTLRKKMIKQSQYFLASSKCPGLAVRRIMGCLWSIAERLERDNIPVDVMADTFKSELDVDINEDEKKSILRAYDLDSSGLVSAPEFANLIRISLSQRRLELVGIFYSLLERASAAISLDSLAEGSPAVTKKIISLYFHPSIESGSLEYLLTNLGVGGEDPDSTPISIDDFADYYACVSAEIEDNATFEGVMRRSWNV